MNKRPRLVNKIYQQLAPKQTMNFFTFNEKYSNNIYTSTKQKMISWEDKIEVLRKKLKSWL